VAAVEAAHAVVGFFAGGGAGEAIAEAADQMAQGMTAQGVTAEQGDIREQDESAYADAKVAVEPAGLPDVVREKQQEDEREIQKIAVDVLEDQRKRSFAPIGFARLAHGAGRWVGPKCFVVGAAIVVAGDAETAGRPEDEHRGGDPGRHPGGSCAEPGLAGRSE